MQGLEGALGRVPETDVASLRQAQRLQDEGALTVRCCEDPRQREEGGAWPHPGPCPRKTGWRVQGGCTLTLAFNGGLES